MSCMKNAEQWSSVNEGTNAEATNADQVAAMTIHPDQISPMVDDIVNQ